MKAAVLPAPSQAVEVRNVGLAEPKAGEVLVRIGGSGLCGCYLGRTSPSRDIPAMVTLYLNGELRLYELVSRRIGLNDLNEAFDRLRAGAEARQVVVFDGSEVAAG
jgi:Zn-dependent alcohol dehydrogenase